MQTRVRISVITACSCLIACGSGGEGPTGPAPGMAIMLGVPTLSVQQGQEGSVTVNISRTNGFSGTVTFGLDGAPAGVAVRFSPASVAASATSSTLTLTVALSVPPGTHDLRVRAAGPGVTAQAALGLTVAAGAPLSIATPADASLVVGEAFSLELDVEGPGPFVFESAGRPLPDGLSLEGLTGSIAGTPTPASLLAGSPVGVWSGIVIRVSNGTSQATTDPFSLSLGGAPLPIPYAYMAFDGTDLSDAFGRAGVTVGNVVAGQPGVIGEGVFIGGANSYIRYPTSLSSQLNGRSAFTMATSIRTSSSGTMFFNLSDRYTHYSRAYMGLDAGRIEFGGRSINADDESFRRIDGNRAVNDGQYHSIVGVLDLSADRATIFVVGRLDATRVMGFARATFESSVPADQNVIGHVTTLADDPVAPDVTHDELALWDLALGEAHAATIAWLARTGRSLREWIGF